MAVGRHPCLGAGVLLSDPQVGPLNSLAFRNSPASSSAGHQHVAFSSVSREQTTLATRLTGQRATVQVPVGHGGEWDRPCQRWCRRPGPQTPPRSLEGGKS